MIPTYLIIFFTGIAVGFVSTIFGIGGGIIMVPLLSLLFSISHLDAMATSCATIVLVTLFNTINFHRKNVIVWVIVPWVAVTSASCGFLSAKIATILPVRTLLIIFLLFLFYITIQLFFTKNIKTKYRGEKFKRLISIGIGGLSGTLSGFTGIGGGGITTPLMLIAGITNNIQAAPTSNAIMIFTTFFTSLSFALAGSNIQSSFLLGYIHLDKAFLLFLGSAFFSRIGVKINDHVPFSWRKKGLILIILLICIRILFML
jgi:uncharacterized membrane protein YfcA